MHLTRAECVAFVANLLFFAAVVLLAPVTSDPREEERHVGAVGIATVLSCFSRFLPETLITGVPGTFAPVLVFSIMAVAHMTPAHDYLYDLCANLIVRIMIVVGAAYALTKFDQPRPLAAAPPVTDNVKKAE